MRKKKQKKGRAKEKNETKDKNFDKRGNKTLKDNKNTKGNPPYIKKNSNYLPRKKKIVKTQIKKEK